MSNAAAVSRRLLYLLAALLAALICPARGVYAEGGAGEPVVLRFRYWGDFKEIQALQDTIRAFEKAHPGVTVRGERVPSGDEYTQKLLLEQAAGLMPDVVFCGANFAEFAGRGMLRDLRPFVAADPSVKLSAYYPQLVDLFTRDEKLLALPRDIAPMGLVYYNKSLFDKAGLPYPDGDWSWDYVPHPEHGNRDFLTVAQKLTHRDPSGAVQKTVFGYSGSGNSTTMRNLIYSSGANVVDDVFRPTRLLWDDPRVLRALTLTRDLLYKYDVSPSVTELEASGVSAHDLFAQGRIAMYVTGIWEVPRFREEIGDRFDWDIAAFPVGPTGVRACPTGWSGYAMTQSTRHPKEAWELLKFLAGPEGLGRLARTGLAQPALSNLAASPLWLDGQRPKNRKLTLELVPHVRFEVVRAGYKEVDALVNPKLDLIWNGTLAPEPAVRAFLPAAQAKLDQLNHPPDHPPLNWGAGFLAMLGVLAGVVGWVWAGARRDRREGRAPGSRAEARAGYLFIAPWLIGAVLFVLGPMLVSLLLAFSSWDIIGPARWVGLGNFREMGGDERFWTGLRVTVVYTLFSVPLGVAGSLGLALLLNAKMRGQRVFRTLYYLPAVASAVAASLIWLRLFNPESGLLNYLVDALHLTPLMAALGWTDPHKGYVNWLGSEKTALGSLVVMSLWGIGGGMVIYLAGLQGIPQAYYEAAVIDGASVWQKFRHVTLPLLTPTIFFTLIMGVIGSFQVFTQGFVMTGGGPNNATLFYVLYLYQNAFQFLKMGYASALAWVLFLIILAFTLVQMRLSRWVHYEGDAK
jgi:multiple sugar transport system permease protein